MASILDSGLLGIFSGIFTFLLVYALVWGVLSWKKPFGDTNTGTYALIAFVVALFCCISTPVRKLIGILAPWYVALALVIFFILFIVSMFGLSAEKDFPKIMLGDSRAYTWIIIISVIILLAGLAFSLGQTTLEAGGNAPVGSSQDTGIGTVGTASGATGDNSGLTVIGQSTPYQAPGSIGVGAIPSTGGYPGYYQSNTGTVQAGQPGSTATSNYQTNMINTLLHPKVLGLLVTVLIAAVAIYFLSSG